MTPTSRNCNTIQNCHTEVFLPVLLNLINSLFMPKNGLKPPARPEPAAPGMHSSNQPGRNPAPASARLRPPAAVPTRRSLRQQTPSLSEHLWRPEPACAAVGRHSAITPRGRRFPEESVCDLNTAQVTRQVDTVIHKLSLLGRTASSKEFCFVLLQNQTGKEKSGKAAMKCWSCQVIQEDKDEIK